MDFLKNILRVFLKVDSGVSRTAPEPLPSPPKPKDTLELELNPVWFASDCIISQLFVDGEFECYILEDRERLKKGKQKIDGETAIPEGTYEIIINYSPRFKQKLPRLLNVPGFTGILIHPGNTAKDTAGCLLPGKTKTEHSVGQSRVAFNALFKKLVEAKEAGKKITIKVGM